MDFKQHSPSTLSVQGTCILGLCTTGLSAPDPCICGLTLVLYVCNFSARSGHQVLGGGKAREWGAEHGHPTTLHSVLLSHILWSKRRPHTIAGSHPLNKPQTVNSFKYSLEKSLSKELIIAGIEYGTMRLRWWCYVHCTTKAPRQIMKLIFNSYHYNPGSPRNCQRHCQLSSGSLYCSPFWYHTIFMLVLLQITY